VAWVSIIIATRDRAASLRETLRHVEALEIPADWDTERIVVDNGSTDETAAIASEFSVTVQAEPRPGASRARNRGAQVSSGEVLLFLDDDMRPPPGWLVGLTGPILRGAGATVSLFRLGVKQHRSSLTDADRGALVTEASMDPAHPFLIAGSMGIRRDLFELIGGFEEELGPGALGAGGEDLLMTDQLRSAGQEVVCVSHVVVEHCMPEAKLTHDALVARAADGARSEAWLARHWHGRVDRFPAAKVVALRAIRKFGRVRRSGYTATGVASWEGVMAARVAWHAQMAIEQRRRRKYLTRER
jgi:glycosyltransferase involved in cell wall biosynthesis